jgi:uncharacterized protein
MKKSKELTINYSNLVDDAMRGVIRQSLDIFSKCENVGDHHFYISFVTKHPKVIISEKLHNLYPYEMTIVLQNQFENLIVEEDGFKVDLYFYGTKETIVIPFIALTAFSDPSVRFGLQLRHTDETLANFNSSQPARKKQAKPSKASSVSKSNVIKLDFSSHD